jgi:malonyl-CoA O-methyltransferase
VIIDKNAEAWGRLETPAWERWFGRKELEKLLARHCRKVSSRLFRIGKMSTGRIVSLAWLAVK